VTSPDAAPTPGPTPGLVAVVATVKGSPGQVCGFVRRNLRAGADHVVVLVDDGDPAVLSALARDEEAGPRVTAIGTGTAYWGDGGSRGQRRPQNLNRRQTIGAGLANTLVSSVPRFAWLFHLDLDERLHLDKDRLLDLDPDVRAVELATWEAVSTETRHGQTRYKRRPTADELLELHRRGLVDRPSLHAYFRGHTSKRGIRPDPRVRLRIHHAMEPGGAVEIEPARREWLQVLHDESDTFEEFVRKWQALLGSGGFGQKPRRERVAVRVAALLTDDALDPDVREQRLRQLYRRHVADDVDALDELGLLAVPDPAWSAYRPEDLTEAERATLAAVAEVLAGAPKRAFDRYGPPSEELLQRLHDRATRRGADPLALEGLQAALTRTSTALEDP
jgi:hypothetical protein